MVCPRNKFSFPRWSISSNTPKALGPFFPPSKCTITGVLLRNICTSQNEMFSSKKICFFLMFVERPMYFLKNSRLLKHFSKDQNRISCANTNQSTLELNLCISKKLFHNNRNFMSNCMLSLKCFTKEISSSVQNLAC